MTEKNYFEILNAIDVSDKVESKNGLKYLSWAWAWAEIKKRYPNAKKNVFKNDNGWLYHTDGKTCWVEVSVIINDIEEVEYLPVMDFRNQSIPLEKITSMNVNTTIQRALTKAIARHGLGLYIYAGEDLPESIEEIVKEKKEVKFITEKDIEDLQDLISKTDKSIQDICKAFNIESLSELPVTKLVPCKKRLDELSCK